MLQLFFNVNIGSFFHLPLASRKWDICRHLIRPTADSATTGQRTEQHIFNILVNQQYDYTGSLQSERKEDKLESVKKRLESS